MTLIMGAAMMGIMLAFMLGMYKSSEVNMPHVPDAARERAGLYRSPYRGVRRRLGSGRRQQLSRSLHLGKPAVRMEQWMFVQPDGRSVLNRATVTVLGIPVARLSETIRR